MSAECELFLAGHYEQYLEARREPIPTWARLNAVAHADDAALVEMASLLTHRCPAVDRPGTWSSARAHIAREVLRVAASEGSAPLDVQQELLVPLEEHLARSGHDRNGRSAVGPNWMVAVAFATLHRHPSAPLLSDLG